MNIYFRGTLEEYEAIYGEYVYYGYNGRKTIYIYSETDQDSRSIGYWYWSNSGEPYGWNLV